MIVYFTIIAAFALFFAHYCAWDDFTQIGKDEPVHHVKQWLIRAGISVAAIIIISGVGEVLTLRMFGLMSVAVAFLFSAWFRYRLNKLRGLEWYYMGPVLSDRTKKDSWYDGLYHWLAYAISGFNAVYYDGYHTTYSLNTPGKIAYATEITLTIAAFTVAAIL